MQVLSGEVSEEEGTCQGADKSSHWYAPIEKSFCNACIQTIIVKDVKHGFGVELSKVDNTVSEVEGGEGDVGNHEGNFGSGSVGFFGFFVEKWFFSFSDWSRSVFLVWFFRWFFLIGDIFVAMVFVVLAEGTSSDEFHAKLKLIIKVV